MELTMKKKRERERARERDRERDRDRVGMCVRSLNKIKNICEEKVERV
jgi:hypothetical protein